VEAIIFVLQGGIAFRILNFQLRRGIMVTKLASEEASHINRLKRVEPETEAEFARVRAYANTLQKLHYYLKGLHDGGKDLPISNDDIDQALDYAQMLICHRRGEIGKTVA
jgi:hypothetical protein